MQYPMKLMRYRILLRTCVVLAMVGANQRSLCAQEAATSVSSSDSITDGTDTPSPLEMPGKPFRQALEGAAAHCEQAIRLSPDDPSNYVDLADSQVMLWCFGFLPGKEVLPKAQTAANKAVELDDSLASAHTTLGVLHISRWEWVDAEREFQRALELDPDSAKARHWYALYLAAMARHDQALQQSEKALELEPTSGYRTGLGAILYFRRDFPRMIQVMEKTVSLDPGFAPGYDWLGMAYVQSGRFEDSVEVYRKAVALSSGLAEIHAGLGHVYAVAGNRAEAERILDEFDRLSQHWHVPPVQIAFVHAGLGEKDEAFQWLEVAFRERSWELAFLQVEPWLDDLRSDQRFTDLSRRMKFPQ